MKHLIKIESTPNGVLGVRHAGLDQQYCEAGELVTLKWQPDAKWGLQEAHYTDGDGNVTPIDLGNGNGVVAFMMPDKNITVGGTFKMFVSQDWTEGTNPSNGEVLTVGNNGEPTPISVDELANEIAEGDNNLVDSIDAINPFKGWYANLATLQASHPSPVVGDYAYVKGAEATDPAAIYECTTAGSWSDSGRTADTSNVQTFASSQEVNEVHIVNDLTTGGTEDVLSAEQGKVINQKLVLMSDPSFVGSYKRTVTNTGSSHSSNNDRVRVDIKSGSKYAVFIVAGTGTIPTGSVFVKYGEDTSSVNVGTVNHEFTAENDITSIGVYWGSGIGTVGTFSLIVVVDEGLELYRLANSNVNAQISIVRKASLFRGSGVDAITYSRTGITIPSGLILSWINTRTMQREYYTIPSNIVIESVGYYKYDIFFNVSTKEFHALTVNLSLPSTNEVYVFSVDLDAATSNIPIDLDGTGITQAKISSNTSRIAILEQNTEYVDKLYYSLDKSTESPFSLINGRNKVLNDLKFYKGVRYSVVVDVTFDTSRAGKLYLGIYKDNATNEAVNVTWSKTATIESNTSHFEITFIPDETYTGNGVLAVSNYNYDSSNVQYVSVTIKANPILKRVDTLEDEVDRIKSLDIGAEEDFLYRTMQQRRRVRQLGYARRTGGSIPTGYVPQLSFMHISDTHGNATTYKYNAENAIDALNALSTNNVNDGNCVQFLIHTGDIKSHNFASDFTYWTTARSLANKPVFHVAGNHDVGFHDNVEGAGTDAAVYDVLVAPFLSEWNLKTDGSGTPHPTGKSYYFTDFTTEKVRLIVLYEYETDWVIDPNDSTKFTTNRDSRAFHQEQITWLIDSLMTTPAGYGVIIAKHQMEGYNDGNVNVFNCPMKKDITGQMQTYVSVNMIADIVNAFRNGTAINETYQQTGNCVNTTQLVVNADFSNKNTGAEFICYLSGHTHCDEVHYVKKYPDQLELTIGCDNINYTDGSDMNQIKDTLSQDVINVYAVDRNIGVVNIVRIGSNLSNTMQKRDVLSLPYRED